MKRYIIYSLIFIILSGLALYIYKIKTEKYNLPKEVVAQRSEEIAIFFNYAKDRLAQIPAEIEKLKKNPSSDQSQLKHLQEEQKTFTLAKAIADHDIKALQEMPDENLKNVEHIWVADSSLFKHTGNGRLAGRSIAGNALALVLYHSATNKTEQDNQITLEMLKLLLTRNVSPNAEAIQVFWVKNAPTDTKAYDYVVIYSPVTIAILYSFPQALELLLQHGAQFKQETLDILNKDKAKIPNATEFERLLSVYSSGKQS